MKMVNLKSKKVKFVHYSDDLKTKLVCILNGQREVGLQMVWNLNGI